MIPYKPLRLEDYMQQQEPQDLEVVAEAAYGAAGEVAEPEQKDEHEEGYKLGINVVADQPEVDEIRQAIADELAQTASDSEKAQEKVRK